MNAPSTREEKDTMGVVRVPEAAYFGAQTQRAADNVLCPELKLPTSLIRALALIKRAGAEVNRALGLLEPRLAEAITAAADEVVRGNFDDQFIVGVFQTGSGTSTNMNLNEVIASRANELLTGRKGGRSPVHPNDHVNLGQSSNDAVPSAIHIAAGICLQRQLIPALQQLQRALAAKSREFADVRKIGRTHLQDAVPMSLGQEFSGYARQVELGIERVQAAASRLSELALGGTAVGTGVNAHPRFAAEAIALIAQQTGIGFREAENHFEAQGARDAAVETSGALRTVAVSLTKIANDLRWLGSGPRCGLGEIVIPALQPGSSIMPGKVNPVIPEAVIQAAAQVVGNDATIALSGMGGNFELNTMLPVIAYNLLQSIDLLAAAALTLAQKCISGITADREACAAAVEKSLALATGLVPRLGYDRAAAVAKAAYDSGKTVREVLLAEGELSAAEIEAALKL
ncbi:MAG: class II fumarate hydratase [Desulfobacterales bacterium]|jgi:fumarate hydratase class II|nr:class II fumarate hydratase [Desulfobacterales bacterium]